ncbi:MAG: hypothetical protein ACK4NA_02240 [Alphaproteobacteria bacterium]
MAEYLAYAAAPVFAAMALLTAATAGAPDLLCAPAASPLAAWLGGMTPMYLLMSLAHAAPWLRMMR